MQVSGTLQGRICGVEQVPGSFQSRINDVARVCYVDRAPGLVQGSDLLRYRDVTGVCVVAKNYALLHESYQLQATRPREALGRPQARNIIIDIYIYIRINE